MGSKLLECVAFWGRALVAQLDRVPGFELGCRGFESLRAHQLNQTLTSFSNKESIVKGMRSRRTRDRRALAGEAGKNALRRKVMVPEWASASRTQDISRLTFSRVMQANFGGTMAKIFREYSDFLEALLLPVRHIQNL